MPILRHSGSFYEIFQVFQNLAKKACEFCEILQSSYSVSLPQNFTLFFENKDIYQYVNTSWQKTPFLGTPPSRCFLQEITCDVVLEFLLLTLNIIHTFF